MTMINLNLPTSFAVTSRGIHVDANPAEFSEDIIQALILHGLTQKVADAAASALKDAGLSGIKFAELDESDKKRVRNIAKSSMQEISDNLAKGVWGVTRSGSGFNHHLAQAVISSLGEDKREAFNKIKESSEKKDFLESAFNETSEENKTALRAMGVERAEEAARQAAAKKAKAEELAKKNTVVLK